MNTSSFSLAKGNELTGDDAFLVKKYDDFIVGIVCDGVGSSEYGAVAAKRVINFMNYSFSNLPKSWSIEKSIKYFITSINAILYQEAKENETDMLTTIALVVIKDNRLYGANVGDSRVYLLRDQLYQLSFDHNVEGMDNVLSEAIGMREDVNIYYFENKLIIGDKILLCSDGLYDVCGIDEIIKYIPLGASLLVRNASKKVNDDLPDDTTAVVIDINDFDKKFKLKQENIPILEEFKKGMIIDGFKLEKSLIQNNLTWLATKKNKKYVLKFPPPEAKEDEVLLDLYVKEAINAVRLKAGFFPKAVIPKKRTYRYYVMEYLDGEVLKNKKLSIDEAVKLAKMLLRAGQYLIKYDLVHGDIKPQNIIKTKTYKLIDFGSITEIFSNTSRAGTPSYLAPERFEDAPINESTEIFAIGVTLYELLTGKYPYGEIEPFQTPKFSTPLEPKKLNKNIPEWLNSVILRAIEVDKDKRYQNYSEMIFELSNPDKVEPYIKIDKDRPLKVALILSLILNVILIYFLV